MAFLKSVIVALAMASTASASAANELSRPHLIKGSTTSVVSKLQLTPMQNQVGGRLTTTCYSLF